MAKFLYWLAPLYTGLIIFLSLSDNKAPSFEIANIDKAYHGIAYLIMTVLWHLFFSYYFLSDFAVQNKNLLSRLTIWSRRSVICASVLSLIIGTLIEFAQGYLSSNRTMDVYDIIANTAGIIIAILLTKLITVRFNILII